VPTPEEVAAAKVTSDAVAAAAAAAKTTSDAAAAAAAAAGTKAEGGEATKDANAQAGETPEQKTARETAAAKAAADAAKPKAPEKYELKLPEGAVINARDVAMIETLAREADLDNVTAQQLLEQHAEVTGKQAATFIAELTADKKYGGEKLAETQQLANAVLDRVRPAGTPQGDAFRAFINRGGVNNSLEVASFLADLGRMTLEDGQVMGSAAKPDAKAEDVLYPNTPAYLKDL